MGTDKRLVIAHLSDPHVGATWGGAADPLARLRACVAAIRAHTVRPDVVIVSGDLADTGNADEYALVREELAGVGLPVHVVPGNHDDRKTLRDCFGLPGEGDAPIDHAQDVGPLRLVMLDSTIPGADRGELNSDQLDWLDEALRDRPKQPTVVVMHHPPLRTGIPAFDTIGLDADTLGAFERILAGNGQVLAVLSGHLHRVVTGTVGGKTALTVPSTYVQVRLDLSATELVVAEEQPPAFAIHTLDGSFTSHVQVVI